MTMRKVSPAVVRYFGALYGGGGGALAGDPDGQLLQRLAATNGDNDRATAELAFEALLKRHGDMVWRVCRSLVLDDHDADDAFQATFVILIQKAGSLHVRRTLGPWLYAVAHRVASSARAASTRRRQIERIAGEKAWSDREKRSPEPLSDISDLGSLMHQELILLPERFRAVVVLCDLEGLSYHRAAALLNVPLGTLQSRLARARRRLRGRLNGRGISAVDTVRGLESASVVTTIAAGRLTPSRVLEQQVTRQCVLLVTEPARFHDTVSMSVRSLVSNGSGSIALYRWNGAVLVSTAAVVLFGALLWNSQTNAQPRQHAETQAKGASAVPDNAKLEAPSTRPAPLFVPPIKEVRATAGRGKALVYALDAKGNRIKGEPVPAKRSRRRVEPAEQNGDRLPNGPPEPDRPDKEEVVDIAWAAVTGVVEQRVIEKVLANGGRVGRRWAEAVYRRVDLERQERPFAGPWSNWQAVDPEPTIRVLDNLPEFDEERTPEDFRTTNLVDPLPILKAGKWDGVDVDRFVPAVHEKRAVPQIGELRGRQAAKRRSPEPPLPPLLMCRQFDFTVRPGHIYRYRARLVVDNARWRRTEVVSGWSEATEPATVPRD